MPEDFERRADADHDAFAFGILAVALIWAVLWTCSQPHPNALAATILSVLLVLSLRLWAGARKIAER